jgi:hypothetical protein
MFRRKIEAAAESQSDEQALQSIELFQRWAERIGVQTPAGKRVQDGGKLWECIQSHTPQADWHPALTPALWKEVSLDEWPEWVQPLGAHDAYALGAHVSHNGSHWESTIADNVQEPGVYGWVEV